MKINKKFQKAKTSQRKKSDRKKKLPSEENLSVSRFVDEGNPDALIKEELERSGENPNQRIPDGDQENSS